MARERLGPWRGRRLALKLRSLCNWLRKGAAPLAFSMRGELHRSVTFKDKLPWVVRWSPDVHTLFVDYWQIGSRSPRQIGFLRDTGGDIEPITRDTYRYSTLALSADGKTLATVLEKSYASVSVLSQVGHEFGEPHPLLSQSRDYNSFGSVTWGTNGSLFLNNLGRLLNLGADGKNQTQLLADSSAGIRHPSFCGANYLVLTWAFHGSTTTESIWRTNVDGTSPRQLTSGAFDMFPVCSSDQKLVYYIDVLGGHISRVPLDGSGKPETPFAMPQGYSLVYCGLSASPGGKMLATPIEESSSGVVKIALFEPGSSSPPRTLDASHYHRGESGLQFTPDGKAVLYVGQEKGVDNIWVQPLDGSAGHPVTDFKSEQIWSFSLSPDGKSLAVLRGHLDSDVVLLQESK